MISVIIPAYNAEENIDRALKSVLFQTYSNLEIIVIDDGSKDNTGKIVDNYAKKDSRIKVYHVENGGEARARNLGIVKAKGEFIAFCDADDYMYPNMLETMISSIKNDGTDMAICSWKNVDEDGNELPWRKTNLKTCILNTLEAQSQFLTTGNIEGFCWNKLFSKKLYDITRTQYDERRVSYCDILANFKLISSSEKISYIGEPLYDYYQLNTACTHVANIRKNYDYLETLVEVSELAFIHGLEKEAHIYTVNRSNKHLFGMYKDIALYDKKQYSMFYKKLYETFLEVSFLRKMLWAIKYPLENPFKFVIKEWIVERKYKKEVK